MTKELSMETIKYRNIAVKLVGNRWQHPYCVMHPALPYCDTVVVYGVAP